MKRSSILGFRPDGEPFLAGGAAKELWAAVETYTGIKVKLTHLAHDWARGERKAHFIAAVHQFHRLLYFFPSSWLYSPFSSDLPVSPQKHYAVNALHLAKKNFYVLSSPTIRS